MGGAGRSVRRTGGPGLAGGPYPLPGDEAVASSYGRLATRVVGRGGQSRRRVVDLLIAATAHAHSASLYTRNAGDLRGLEDLVDIISV